MIVYIIVSLENNADFLVQLSCLTGSINRSRYFSFHSVETSWFRQARLFMECACCDGSSLIVARPLFRFVFFFLDGPRGRAFLWWLGRSTAKKAGLIKGMI